MNFFKNQGALPWPLGPSETHQTHLETSGFEKTGDGYSTFWNLALHAASGEPADAKPTRAPAASTSYPAVGTCSLFLNLECLGVFRPIAPLWHGDRRLIPSALLNIERIRCRAL